MKNKKIKIILWPLIFCLHEFVRWSNKSTGPQKEQRQKWRLLLKFTMSRYLSLRVERLEPWSKAIAESPTSPEEFVSRVSFCRRRWWSLVHAQDAWVPPQHLESEDHHWPWAPPSWQALSLELVEDTSLAPFLGRTQLLGVARLFFHLCTHSDSLGYARCTSEVWEVEAWVRALSATVRSSRFYRSTQQH